MNALIDPKTVLDDYKPATWSEGWVLGFAGDLLEDGLDPAVVLDSLDAARDELNDWITLEKRYGVAEVFKLAGHQLSDSFARRGVTPAATWLAKLSGSEVTEEALDPDVYAMFSLMRAWGLPRYSRQG